MRINAFAALLLAGSAGFFGGMGALLDDAPIVLLGVVFALCAITFAVLAVGDVLSERDRT